MKKIISVLILTMYIVTNFAFTVSAETDASIYESNLFGDVYGNCDTVTDGVGVQGTSGTHAFEESVETGEDSYDGASIKLTGRKRNLFEKTVSNNLLGKKVKVSLKLKMSEAAYATDGDKPVRFYYKVLYNDGTTDGSLSQVYVETSNTVKTVWQNFSVEFDIPADGVLAEGQTYTGISFYARIGGGLSGVADETSAWIDCISLNAILGDSDLLTSVTSISANTDADKKTQSIEVVLDNPYVNESGLDDMMVVCDGAVLLAGTDYTVAVSGTKITITFAVPEEIYIATVSGIKDRWGRAVDCTNASLMVECKKAYTTNLLGELYTEFADSSLNASGYTAVVDGYEKVSGTGSLQLTGSCGYNSPSIVNQSFPMTSATAPDKLQVSFWVKASEDILLKCAGDHAMGSAYNGTETPSFTRMRLYLDATYKLPDGSSSKYTLLSPIIYIKDDYADWQYVSTVLTPNYSRPAYGTIPAGAEITELGVSIRLDIGRALMEIAEGSVWIDEVRVHRIPEDDEYLATLKSVSPEKESFGVEANDVTFTFEGLLNEGLLHGKIRESDTGVETEASLQASYDEETNISTVTVTPIGGFKSCTNYVVELTDVFDLWGRTVEGAETTSVRTSFLTQHGEECYGEGGCVNGYYTAGGNTIVDISDGFLLVTGTGEMGEICSTSGEKVNLDELNITTVFIREGITAIDENVFNGCEGLTEVEIPLTISAIGSNVFANCPNITDVHYYGYEEDWSKITIGDGNDALKNAKMHYHFEFELSFDLNGGDGNIANVTMINGYVGWNLPTPTREGHTFVGWFTEREGGKQILSTSKVNVDGDTTLYAHWRVNSCQVHFIYYPFDDRSNYFSEEYECSYGDKVRLLDLKRDGYKFLGWYTARDGGEKVTEDTVIKGNFYFYAQWELIEEPDGIIDVVQFEAFNGRRRLCWNRKKSFECLADLFLSELSQGQLTKNYIVNLNNYIMGNYYPLESTDKIKFYVWNDMRPLADVQEITLD